MKALVDALRGFLVLTTQAKILEPVDAADSILVLANLHQVIEEKGAVVTHDPLPSIKGDPAQMVQLFQNLIGNVLKFCDGTPRVHVTAERTGEEWVFSVVRQRHRHHAGAPRADLPDLPAAARAGQVPRHGDGAGDLQEGGGAARGPDLGRVAAGPGEYLFLHPPGRGQETIMTMRESPRPPGLLPRQESFASLHILTRARERGL